MNKDLACLDVFSNFEFPQAPAAPEPMRRFYDGNGTDITFEVAGGAALAGLSLLAVGGAIELGGRLLTGRFNKTGAVVGAGGTAILAYGFHLTR